MANRQQINQRQVAMTGGVSQVQQQSQQQQQQQQQQVVLERTPATAMMGFPGEIRQITNPKTQQVEVVQTCMIVVELQSNQWGYGINLNDSDGVVRIEGKRANNDGTPSPAQQNSNIEKGDVIYKVQNVVLGGNNPLNVVRTMSGNVIQAVQTMQQSKIVKLTLLRHVPISNTKSKIRMEPQVYCDLNQEQVFEELSYLIISCFNYSIKFLYCDIYRVRECLIEM